MVPCIAIADFNTYVRVLREATLIHEDVIMGEPQSAFSVFPSLANDDPTLTSAIFELGDHEHHLKGGTELTAWEFSFTPTCNGISSFGKCVSLSWTSLGTHGKVSSISSSVFETSSGGTVSAVLFEMHRRVSVKQVLVVVSVLRFPAPNGRSPTNRRRTTHTTWYVNTALYNFTNHPFLQLPYQ